MIEDNWASLAIHFTIPIKELSNPPITIPYNMRDMESSLFLTNIADRNMVIVTAMMPPTKEKILIIENEYPNKMAIDAPHPASADTPRISGDTIRLANIS